MNASLKLFTWLILRPLKAEPIRTALTLFAVALGVGVVIAIDLAGQAATNSFHSSLQSLTGKSDLVIRATGGVDENLLSKLVQLPYAFEFNPRIADFASVNGKGEAVPFIGLDLIAYLGAAHEFKGEDLEHLAGESAIERPVWVSGGLGLRRGEQVRLLINDVKRSFTVAGVLKGEGSSREGNNVIVADIGLAQAVTGKTGKLDSIDVEIPRTAGLEYWRELLSKELPSAVTLEPQGTQTEQNRKMLAAFRWNLTALSYIALVVGGFLIYNTISISVVRRRNAIGIARALGATRAAVTGAFLAEALFFAVTGSALGVIIGRLMAVGAVRLIGTTVNALYISSSPGTIALTPGAIATGISLGVCISLLAALGPAFEAARIAPVEAMARGREQYTVRVRSGRMMILALLMLAGGGVLSQLPPVNRQPIFAYAAVMLLVGGTAAAIPSLVTSFAAIGSRTLERVAGVEALLAMRSLRASLGRTSVLTAALATAVAMTASVGIMVGSFRETVTVWMNDQLKADFYLRPAGAPAADRTPTMTADIADSIERLPGVAAADRFRIYEITYEGMPAALAGTETAKEQGSMGTRFLAGNRTDILPTLPTGDYAVVSEPFSNKHQVHVGSSVELPLGGAKRSFKVVGIFYDYSTERGVIVLDRHTLLKYLPDPAISSLAVSLKPGANAAAVRRGISGILSGRAVLVFSNNTLRTIAMEIFDRTFRITYALEAVAIVVAVTGIAGALLAMVIDRRREFALLQFLGGGKPQIRNIILCEAGLLGLLANAIGLALGTVLSLILIFVINKQSFGWTFQFHWPAAALLEALTGIYLATVLAGLYPARTATATKPIEVIHEE